MAVEEDPPPARRRTSLQLMDEYRRHEKFMHSKTRVPTREELDREWENLELRKEFLVYDRANGGSE